MNIPANVRTILINIAFFVLVIAVAGHGRDVFFSSGTIIIALVFFSIVRVLGIGLLYKFISTKRGMDRNKVVPGSLFVTYKNTGMAAALALVLVGPDAAVPAAVTIVVEISWLILAGKYLFGENSESASPEPHKSNT